MFFLSRPTIYFAVIVTVSPGHRFLPGYTKTLSCDWQTSIWTLAWSLTLIIKPKLSDLIGGFYWGVVHGCKHRSQPRAAKGHPIILWTFFGPWVSVPELVLCEMCLYQWRAAEKHDINETLWRKRIAFLHFFYQVADVSLWQKCVIRESMDKQKNIYYIFHVFFLCLLHSQFKHNYNIHFCFSALDHI